MNDHVDKVVNEKSGGEADCEEEDRWSKHGQDVADDWSAHGDFDDNGFHLENTCSAHLNPSQGVTIQRYIGVILEVEWM